jgi:hypothetical protein
MNDWATSYTPAFGLRSLFNNGLDGSVQGLSQNGANAAGAGLKAFGQAQMGGGQSSPMSNPGMAFAGGLQNGQQMQKAFGEKPDEAKPAEGGGGGMYMGGILPGLLGGKFGGFGGGGMGGGSGSPFDIKKLFGGFG